MKLSKEGIINKFKKQHIALKILDVVCIVLLIHDIIVMQISQITIFCICLSIIIPILLDLFKKEES